MDDQVQRNDAFDILRSLLQHELIYSCVPSDNDKKSQVNETWRWKVCKWFFDVVDHFEFHRDIVSIAVNYLDRAINSNILKSFEASISIRDYQLVAATCLYTAIKQHGVVTDAVGKREKLRIKIDVIVALSQGFLQEETILAMERSLLISLDGCLDPPTPEKFVLNITRLLPQWSVLNNEYASRESVAQGIFDAASYLTELSVSVSALSIRSSSIIAYASILWAIDILRELLPFPLKVREQFLNDITVITGFEQDMIEVVQVKILLMDACPSLEECDLLGLIEAQSGMEPPVSASEDNWYDPEPSRSYPKVSSE